MSEKIIVANTYGGSNKQGPALAQWFKRLGFTVVLISELGWLADDLSKIGKVVHGEDKKPHDVGILVAPWVARLVKGFGFDFGRLTPWIKRRESPRLWRDRWYVRVRIFNRVYYSIHANAVIAGPEGNWLDNEGARVWREAMRKLAVMIREDKQSGLRVRIGGDFNFPATSEVEWSPIDFFEDLGLKWFSDGRVMYVAWDPEKDELVSKNELPIAPGADAHAVLKIVLKRRKKTRR